MSVISPTVVGEDGVVRPTWADRSPSARRYFDSEWGREVRSESGLLELIVLFGFAGGLTWSGVLGRREAFAEYFYGYDADLVAGFTEADVERGLADARLIRNRRKIEAAVQNARATCAIRASGGLADLVWAGQDRDGAPVEITRIPVCDDASTALAAALKAAGFTRVGPVSAQALRLASGALPVRGRETLTPTPALPTR